MTGCVERDRELWQDMRAEGKLVKEGTVQRDAAAVVGTLE